MKRVILFLLTLALLMTLAGCTEREGEFYVYEGKIARVEAPTGDNTLLFELANGWKLRTGDNTRCFDAEKPSDAAAYLYDPQLSDFEPGDRLRVWAGEKGKDGFRTVYCILKNGGMSGSFYAVDKVVEDGDELSFTALNGTVTVTAPRESILPSPDALKDGVNCFVWHELNMIYILSA